MKKIAIIVILIIIAAALYMYKLYRQQTPDIVNSNPDIAISAKDLLEAFTNDTAMARKKFVDKVVEVTGNVMRIDTAGAIVLGETGSPMEVVFGIDRRHLNDYKKINQGSIAVLQGICSGNSGNTSSNDPNDLLAGLGTTVEFRSAGVKGKK